MIARMRELNETARAAGRNMTTEEQSEFDGLQRSVEQIDAQGGESQAQPTGTQQHNVPPATGETPVTRAQSTEADTLRAIQEERARVTEIAGICREFGVEASNYITEGTPVAEVRRNVMDELVRTRAPHDVRITQDEQDVFRTAAADSLLVRAGQLDARDAQAAMPYASMTLRGIAEECLERDGVEGVRRMSATELLNTIARQFFNPTAAFPSIMDQMAKKAYETGYNKVNVTFDKFCGRGTLSDFKETKGNYLAGPAGEFLEVAENGELKHDTPEDKKLPSRKLKTFGRQFTMTRQAFINDDINLLVSIPVRYGQSSRRTINKQVFTLLHSNPAVFDDKTLFHSDHRNLLTAGSKPTREAVLSMLLKLSLQKDQFGEPILITPKFLIVPVGYEDEFTAIFKSATIETADNAHAANSLIHRNLEVIGDPTLNALAGANACPWFLSADPNEATTVQVDYYNGIEVPTINRKEVAGVLGFVWDIFLDWGVTAVDFRGMVKNPGEPLPLDMRG